MKLKYLWGAAFAIFASAAVADFADPLDTPALESRLAMQGVINGLAFAGKRVVAVGNRGHILYSDDAGVNWQQARVPLSSDLTALSFADAQHGWAVGHDGVVLSTRDGGQSWIRQLDGRRLGPLLRDFYARASADIDETTRVRLLDDAVRMTAEGPTEPFLDVWFENAQHGFVVGAFNLILETRDGGASWIPWLHRTDNPRNLHLYAIRQTANGLYIAGEQGLLLKLSAAEQRFHAVTLPYHGTLFGIAGDASGVIVFGLRGNAWRSHDGVSDWTRLDTGVEVSLTAAVTDPAGHIVLASQTGNLLSLSQDGAADAINTGARVPAGAVLVLADGTFIIGGPGGLHHLASKRAQDHQP